MGKLKNIKKIKIYVPDRILQILTCHIQHNLINTCFKWDEDCVLYNKCSGTKLRANVT